MKKLRIAIYVRVSDEDEIQSLNEQVEISKALIESYCKRHNRDYEIAIILKEAPGTSGASNDRPKYNELCSLIRNGTIDAIAAKESSRIGRDIGISEDFKKLVKKHNIILIIPGLEDGINSSTGELMYDFMSILSSAERNRIIERTISSIASLARTKKKVHGGTLPLGFKWISKGVIEPIPSEIKVVNFIFDTFLKTATINDTLELLKEAGIKTRSGNICDRAFIERIIQNKKYISQYRVPCSPIEEYVTLDYPVQVPLDKFQEANRLLSSLSKKFSKSTRKKSRVYLLSNLIYTKAGSKLGTTSGKGIPYYRAKNEDISIRATIIEKAIIDALVNISQNESHRSFLASRSVKVKASLSPLQYRKEQLTQKIKELHKREEVAKEKLLTEKLTINLINVLDNEIAQIHTKLSAYDKEIEETSKTEAKQQAEAEKTQAAVRNLYQAVPHVLNNGKPEIIRGIIRQLIKKITIDPKSMEITLTWRVPHSSEHFTISDFNVAPVKKQDEIVKVRLFGIEGTPVTKTPLYDCYVTRKLSSKKTASELGVSKTSVLKYLEIANIPRRNSGKNIGRKRGVSYGKKFNSSGKISNVMSEIKRKEIMLKMRQSDITYQAIADHFNDLGIKTKSGKGKWHRKTIHQILHPK